MWPCTAATRFIPALAGNTPTTSQAARWRPVHPRARGEHACNLRALPLEPGSSPRSRGTPAGPEGIPAVQRFIPALAGNTRRPPRGCHRLPVHPRARGEHTRQIAYWLTPNGSSPRSRGTPVAVTPPVSVVTVHPRARGEHADPSRGCGPHRGSSPRSRGTREHGGRLPVQVRFIPALAGNTAGSLVGKVILSGSSPRSRGTHLRR